MILYIIFFFLLCLQSELDKIQEEFRNAYKDRNSLIANWEKVMNQIQLRNDEIKKLSEVLSFYKNKILNVLH